MNNPKDPLLINRNLQFQDLQKMPKGSFRRVSVASSWKSMEKLTSSPHGELVVIYGGETNPGDKSPFCCLYGFCHRCTAKNCRTALPHLGLAI